MVPLFATHPEVTTGVAAGGPSNGSQTTLLFAVLGLLLAMVALAALATVAPTRRRQRRTLREQEASDPAADLEAASAQVMVRPSDATPESEASANASQLSGSTIVIIATICGVAVWLRRRRSGIS